MKKVLQRILVAGAVILSLAGCQQATKEQTTQEQTVKEQTAATTAEKEAAAESTAANGKDHHSRSQPVKQCTCFL